MLLTLHETLHAVNDRHARGGQQRTQELFKLERLLIPIPDVCAALSVGRTTAYELIKDGHLVNVSIGRRSFVTAESLRAYVDRLSEAATA
jgi:predicted DNA-binding transcriptional regulator AlpA